MKKFERLTKWILVNDYNKDGILIGRKWICSKCKYTALSWSLFVENIRNGIPYEKPTHKFCPNCGENLNNMW